MSYMVHHAIIVTSSDQDLLEKAHTKAIEIFGRTVSRIIKSPINGYRSFFIGPDGSKEDWQESTTGNRQRAEFVFWLDQQRNGDFSSSLDWVELKYGDDAGDTSIVWDSDRWKRKHANRSSVLAHLRALLLPWHRI